MNADTLTAQAAAPLSRAEAFRFWLKLGFISFGGERVGLPHERLPLLWDCDFMLGEAAPGEPERHVLCEINVSSVSPFPPSSIAPLVQAVRSRLWHRRWPDGHRTRRRGRLLMES